MVKGLKIQEQTEYLKCFGTVDVYIKKLTVCHILYLKLGQKLVLGFTFETDRLGLGSRLVLDREQCFWNRAGD